MDRSVLILLAVCALAGGLPHPVLAGDAELTEESGSVRSADAVWLLDAAEAAIGVDLQTVTTEHYRLYIHEASLPEARHTMDALNSLWSSYQGTIEGLVALPERRDKVAVIQLGGPQALSRFAGVMPSPPDGQGTGLLWTYSPPLVAYDASGLLGPDDVGVLFAAVIRVAQSVLLYDPGVEGSWWVREGFGIYFMQAAHDREYTFQSGKVRSSEGYITDITEEGRLITGLAFAEEPRKALSRARKNYRKGRQLPLRDLLAHPATAPWPDEETRDQASVTAWMLVHFLLHGRQGDLRPRPAAYLVRERRGEGGVESFRKTVSGDLDRFEYFIYEHTRSMK